jgi:hypothetical protein
MHAVVRACRPRFLLAFTVLMQAGLASNSSRAGCEIDRATFRPVIEAKTGDAGTAVANAVPAPTPGPSLRAYSAGSELRWELTHDQAARTGQSVLPLLFRTDIDRVTGRWTMVGLAVGGIMGLNSAIVRYDANGTEVADGGAEVGFVRVDGLTLAALAYGLPDLPPTGLWKVVACQGP